MNEMVVGAIMNNYPVLLTPQGMILRTLGSDYALSCVVDGNKVIVCQTNGVVKLYTIQGLVVRMYALPQNVKGTSASFAGSNQILIVTSDGKTRTFTLDGQPLRIF